MLLCLFAISCGDNDYEVDTNVIVSSDFKLVDEVYELSVESTVANFNLVSKIKVADGVSITVSETESFDDVIDGESVALEYGSNTFFVKVTYEDEVL